MPKATMSSAPRSASVRERRSVTDLLRPLESLVKDSEHVFAAHLAYTDPHGVLYTVPRFLFTGPGDRRNYLRVGIFAGIHGDEPSGVLAALALLERLERDPEPARGYELFVYPVCNPTGFADGTRWSRSGKDLNREFWNGSEEIEVILLEQQLMRLNFDGLIALHTDDTSSGLYGFVKGHSLTRYVLEPALEKAGEILPRNLDRSIDNFLANNGIIEQGYPGILSAPPTQKQKPFEVVFETPHDSPMEKQINAHMTAVLVILERFRVLIAEAQNI